MSHCSTPKPVCHTQTLRNRPVMLTTVCVGRTSLEMTVWDYIIKFPCKNNYSFLASHSRRPCALPTFFQPSVIPVHTADYSWHELYLNFSDNPAGPSLPLLFPAFYVPLLKQCPIYCLLLIKHFLHIHKYQTFLLCPDLHSDTELFLLPSKINTALAGQRSGYHPSATYYPSSRL